MFKLSLSAGHYLYTPGKRIPKELDQAETREWVLNDRVCDEVDRILGAYPHISVLRLDDTNGKKNVTLEERAEASDAYRADLYLAVHHNAGINGGSGGGIVAYIGTKAKAGAQEWRDSIYAALIKETGLKGNRSEPMAVKALYECNAPKAPSVLLELGFMDSKTDSAIILSEEYAKKCAKAITDSILKVAIGSAPVVDRENITIPEIKLGDSGAIVEALQILLNGYGYPCGEVDGKFGFITASALKEYQRTHGLPQDAIARKSTWTTLLN